MSSIDFESAQPEELFVLGRNIYQAACGNCFDCQRFIDNFTSYAYIPDKGKEHLLNGMAFEIYYDHEGRKRKHFKTGYAVEVIKLLESEEFFGSREFIASRLENVSTIGWSRKVHPYSSNNFNGGGSFGYY